MSYVVGHGNRNNTTAADNNNNGNMQVSTQ